MPETRAFTGNLASITAAADAALQAPQGIEVRFLAPDYPTGLDGAASAARSFQKTFSSLRARTRKLQAHHLGESSAFPPPTTLAQSIYDKLVCERARIIDGWVIRLMPVALVQSSFALFDIATGEALTTTGAGLSEVARLIDKHLNHREDFTPTDRE